MRGIAQTSSFGLPRFEFLLKLALLGLQVESERDVGTMMSRTTPRFLLLNYLERLRHSDAREKKNVLLTIMNYVIECEMQSRQKTVARVGGGGGGVGVPRLVVARGLCGAALQMPSTSPAASQGVAAL
jgi:hypothetical protein